MSLIAHLRTLFDRTAGLDEPAEHLTVAVLLGLVAHADGRMLDVEENGLRTVLRSRFHLTEEQTDRLVAQARQMEGLLDPATTLVDRIRQDIAPDQVPRLLALAYRIAAVDGDVHEFEDDLVWRTGRLLGLSDGALAVIKRDALNSTVGDQADG